MRRLAAILFLLCATPLAADDEEGDLEERITSGLSSADVPITATFTGSEILVFGAIERNRFFRRDEDTLPDIAIAIRGPANPLLVRKKERVGGVWTNNAAVFIASAPAYYAVASTKPTDEILTPFALQAARIALDQTVFIAGTPFSARKPELFREAVLRIRQEKGLYGEDPDSVTMIGPSLFEARFALPYNIVEGFYTVRVLLIRDGAVIDESERTISVHKDQFGQRINELATTRPFSYGLLSVLIALFAGWSASEAFRRLRR